MNPQFSCTAVENFAPQAVVSLPPFEEFTALVYNQIHQEQIDDWETNQNTFENAFVQEQVIFQEIPHAPQVVDSFPLLEDVAAREYNQVHHEQLVATVQPYVPFHEFPEVQVAERIQEQIVKTIDVTPQASQMTFNTSSTSTSSFVPVCNHVPRSSSTSTGSDRLDALARMLDSCIEQLTPLAAQTESIEKETERVAMLTKRMMESPLPEPPVVVSPWLEHPVVVCSSVCETP